MHLLIIGFLKRIYDFSGGNMSALKVRLQKGFLRQKATASNKLPQKRLLAALLTVAKSPTIRGGRNKTATKTPTDFFLQMGTASKVCLNEKKKTKMKMNF